MFAVIYRAYLKPGKEKEYQTAWQQVVSYFIKECGALGSNLHKTSDDLWVAYSRWPNKTVRDAAWPREDSDINPTFPLLIKNAIATLQYCLDQERKFPDIEMEVINEQLHDASKISDPTCE